MDRNLIFLPVLVQVALTLFMFIRLGAVKSRAMRLGEVDERRRALHKDAWPDYVLKVANNIDNQFETPVLFYVLSFMAWANDGIDWLLLSLCWGFVGTRLAHAYIHVGANLVALRRKVFTAGVLILVLLAALDLRPFLGL
ncbi:MAPEG family protein [Devosia sp.]|uniref:MAPEG family protein n=1 Tax=Devosia sp. TaxID=1871048 RepID=UPI0027348AE2|nr:MAPEG family protein [Devosia sp.]MDP2780124.1 MAPEG family protein [Devosia sp.]